MKNVIQLIMFTHVGGTIKTEPGKIKRSLQEMLKGLIDIRNIKGNSAQAEMETQTLLLSWENTSAKNRKSYSVSLPRAIQNPWIQITSVFHLKTVFKKNSAIQHWNEEFSKVITSHICQESKLPLGLQRVRVILVVIGQKVTISSNTSTLPFWNQLCQNN